jgi:DNA-binding transcriptional LysR family regulator
MPISRRKWSDRQRWSSRRRERGLNGDGYWLVHLESRRNTPKIKVFRDWVLAQTADIRQSEARPA